MSSLTTPERIRFQLLYRNSIGGSVFYLIAIILLLTTRAAPLSSWSGWLWLVTCVSLILIRSVLTVIEGRQQGRPSFYFITCSLGISVAISMIAWFPTGDLEQGPIVFLFCFFLMTLGFSMVFHVMPMMVLLNNALVLGVLTIYYLLRLDEPGGSADIHWITMAFFPLLFIFNVSLTRQMSRSTTQTIELFDEIKDSNQQIRSQAEDLKILAEENLTIARKAQAASESKSSFLANISHEIRTPLNTVIGFSQILESDKSIPQQCLENIKRINISGQHLLLLINDVLDMSKIEANKLELDPEPAHLRELLSTSCDLMRGRANDIGIELELIIEDNVPDYIETDSLKLRRVIFNLLGNALKFTQQGEIILSASFDDASKLFTIGVRDTGKGIRAEEQKKLFRPFEQSVDNSNEGGTGLGLSISRSIVEMMDGKIDVESEFGKGSYFYMQIPFPILSGPERMLNQQEVSCVDGGSESYDIGQSRVLVVDDIENNRLLLTTVLKQLNIDACEASDGHEAIEIWQKGHHHLILMDKRMPNLDGYEAAKRIKQQAEENGVAHPVIIAVSADAISDCDSDGGFGGFLDGFIAKPFDIRDVRTRIEQILVEQSEHELAMPLAR